MSSSDTTQYTHDLFVSYSHADKVIVLDLVQKLRQKGITVWIDCDQIRVGDRYPAKLEEGLLSTRFLLICLSKNYRRSEWCQTEYQSILAVRMKRNSCTLLPVVIDDCDENDIPLFLQDRHYVDARQQSGIDELLKRFSHVGSPQGNHVLEAQRDLIHLRSKNLSGDDCVVAFTNFGVRLCSMIRGLSPEAKSVSELVAGFKDATQEIIGATEKMEYRRLLWQQLSNVCEAAAKFSDPTAIDYGFNIFSVDDDSSSESPFSFQSSDIRFDDAFNSILSDDELDRDEGIDWLFRDGASSMRDKFSYMTDTAYLNEILDTLWSFSPRILLHYHGIYNDFLRYLASSDAVKWKKSCDLLKQIMSPNVNPDKVLPYLQTLPERQRSIFEKYLVLSQNERCRDYAVQNLVRPQNLWIKNRVSAPERPLG